MAEQTMAVLEPVTASDDKGAQASSKVYATTACPAAGGGS